MKTTLCAILLVMSIVGHSQQIKSDEVDPIDSLRITKMEFQIVSKFNSSFKLNAAVYRYKKDVSTYSLFITGYAKQVCTYGMSQDVAFLFSDNTVVKLKQSDRVYTTGFGEEFAIALDLDKSIDKFKSNSLTIIRIYHSRGYDEYKVKEGDGFIISKQIEFLQNHF